MRVIAAVHRPTDLPADSVVVGDIADHDHVGALVETSAADVVFHLAGFVSGARELAAVHPAITANLLGSVNVLEAATAAGCDRVVLIGSGEQPEPISSEPPSSPYAAAKIAQSVYAAMFHALYDTPVTTARVFMAYGPDQPDVSKVVPYAITNLLRGEAPRLSSGRKRCDWVYIDDVVDALVVVAQEPAAVGRAIDVGTGLLRSVREVVDAVAELCATRVVPAWGALPDRALEPEHVADATATLEVLGWSAATRLDEGLDATVEWYRAHADGGALAG